MNKLRRGFTIIEVVLVLAIAGLIFLMVFYVFPTAQTSQRDIQRRQDMSLVSSAVVNFQNNNTTKRNNLPGNGDPSTWNAQADPSNYGAFGECSTAACRFVRDYLNNNANGTPTISTFNDPDGIPYSFVITNNYASSEVGETGLVCNTASGGPCPFKSETVGDTTGYTLNAEFKDRTIYLVPGAQCKGEQIIQSTVRHFAILYKLEGSGVYCLDDQRTATN